MADPFRFELVSPERRLASVEATEVQIPGADGDITAMTGHAPVITTLRPGILRVTHGGKTDEYAVSGGFAEIRGDSVSVLAERSHHRTEMTADILQGWVDEAAEAHRRARETFKNEPGPVDDAAKLLSDMVGIGTHIGLDPRQPNL